jgi:cell division protease FtsH
MRQAGGGGPNRAMQFGRSRARKMEGADRPTITFNDVAGSDEAKQELSEVVEFLKEPQKFAALGARIPKGVLMVGAPGTGKTLLAKAVAGEAGVPFFASSGSEFVEMFVGVGASRVRDLFEQAKRNSPCIIFIDEIDAVGRHRGAGLGGGNDEREQTLNQILVEMDGFDSQTNIVIVAATNRPDILDPALLRPGRFDRKVVVDRPDRRGREAILRVHARGKPLATDVDMDIIAAQTPGMVGADLENLINEAAILAARRNKRTIGMDELVESIERVMAGPARRSRVLDASDRRIVAYHEAGHAIVMENLEHADTVGKITIVSRGQALGYVMPLPEDDRTLRSRDQFEDEIASLLGGRVAEDIIFDEPSTGALSDLERVTKLAKAMVTRYGMSEAIGPLQLQHGDSNPFMGMEFGEQRSYSEEVARKIDQEVRRIIDRAYGRSREILLRNKDKLVLIAETLLEKEVLDRQEFMRLIGKPAAA